jgi:prepilin-type N-terminal cleavage/methylation domain-containing protein
VTRNLRQRGFSLIELLVVVALVGILSAIAIPQYAVYRARAYDARVEYDAVNAAKGEEAAYADTQAYVEGDCTALPGFNPSADVACSTQTQSCPNGAPGFVVRTQATVAGLTSYTVGCTWNSCLGTNGNLNCS